MTNKKFENIMDFVPAEDRVNANLLENHVHFLYGDIEEDNIMNAIYWITYENMLPGDNVLTLYINSMGGSLTDAFALIDVMRTSRKPIRTIGLGSVISAAFLIFASGSKDLRIISKNASIMCHQFSSGMDGKYHDIKAITKENELTNERMINLLKECSGLDTKTIKNKLLPPTDVWFKPEEIVKLGIADSIF
jgi:ATP-dependent Clp protease, protease subunit